jgi:hypothetical protein
MRSFLSTTRRPCHGGSAQVRVEKAISELNPSVGLAVSAQRRPVPRKDG